MGRMCLKERLQSSTVEFLLPRDEENFKKDKQRLDERWVFFDKKVNYIINEEGFRMKPFSEIDEKNYILVLGCSDAMGHGLAYEDTFGYKLSQHYNCDLVNLATPGNTNENISYALIRFLHQNKDNLPKFIAINWTSVLRKSFFTGNDVENLTPGTLRLKTKLAWSRVYEGYLTLTKRWIRPLFKSIYEEAHMLTDIMNIPLYDTTTFVKGVSRFDIPVFLEHKVKKNHTIDYLNDFFAQDLAHPGIKIHDDIFRHIVREHEKASANK